MRSKSNLLILIFLVSFDLLPSRAGFFNAFYVDFGPTECFNGTGNFAWQVGLPTDGGGVQATYSAAATEEFNTGENFVTMRFTSSAVANPIRVAYGDMLVSTGNNYDEQLEFQDPDIEEPLKPCGRAPFRFEVRGPVHFRITGTNALTFNSQGFVENNTTVYIRWRGINGLTNTFIFRDWTSATQRLISTNTDIVSGGFFEVSIQHDLLTGKTGDGLPPASAACSGSINVEFDSLQPSALDAKPANLLIDLPVSPLDDFFFNMLVDKNDQQRIGATADGVTKILLKHPSRIPGTVSFGTVGKVSGEKLTRIDSADVPLEVPTRVALDGTNYAFAVYTVPDGIPISGEKCVTNDFITVFAPFDGSDPITNTISFKLYRPPVILVHGLWSSPGDTWTGDEKTPVSKTYTMLMENGFTVSAADYQDWNAKHFSENEYAIWPAIEQMIFNYENEGIAMTQVDVVAHSMGAIVTRYFAQSPIFHDNDQNYGKGYIRRMITMGSPHLGSDMATFFYIERQNNPDCAAKVGMIIGAAKGPVDQGAVDDLRPGSAALNAMDETSFPGHAIACDTAPDDHYFWDGIQAVLNYLHLGEPPCDFDPYSINSPKDLIRSLFFDQPNDRVVQLVSQKGGLTGANVSIYGGPNHGAEPSDPTIASRVVELLTGPKIPFFAPFPKVNTLQPDIPGEPPPLQLSQASAADAIIVAPADGQLVNAGSVVNFEVTTILPQEGSTALVAYRIGEDLTALSLTNIPGSVQIKIPTNYHGPIQVQTIVRGENGISSGPLVRSFFAQTAAPITNIRTRPVSLIITDAATPLQLGIIGEFADGISYDISAQKFGTSYGVSGSDAITVGTNGAVLAFGNNSSGQIVVTNGSFTISIPYSVSFARPQVLAAAITKGRIGDSHVTVQVFGRHFGGTTNVIVLNDTGVDSEVKVTTYSVSHGGSVLEIRLEVSPAAVYGERKFRIVTPAGTEEQNNIVLFAGPSHPALPIARASAQESSFFLASDGSLWGMGHDRYGQLGNGRFITNLPYGTPRFEQLISNGVAAVAPGVYHTLVQMTNGSLWSMGRDQDGQLGDGGSENRARPFQIVSNDVVGISAGFHFSFFIKKDGSMWAMGRNDFGQLGNGSTNSSRYPIQIVSSNVTAIDADYYHALFVKENGSLWAMGRNDKGQLGTGTTNNTSIPTQIVPGDVVSISAGGSCSFFTKKDGSLWATGDGSSGELGYGGLTNLYSPRMILPSDIAFVSAGNYDCYFIRRDGSLWGMGENVFGELGDGTTSRSVVPRQIVSGGVTSVAAGDGYVLFTKRDGSLWAMGLNFYGGLGDNTFSDSHEPKLIVGAAYSDKGSILQTLSLDRTLNNSVPVTSGFGLHVNGTGGATAILESSDDLSHWLPLQTNFLVGGSTFFPVSPGRGDKTFFRGVLQ